MAKNSMTYFMDGNFKFNVCSSRPKRIPLFVVEIIMDLNGVQYSTPINTFETSLVALFNKGIQLCQNIPCVEKVMIIY